MSCYDVGESKVLVTLQKGWEGFELKDFLIGRPEVASVTWDQMTYNPGDEGTPADVKKKRSKGKAAKAKKNKLKKKKQKKTDKKTAKKKTSKNKRKKSAQK